MEVDASQLPVRFPANSTQDPATIHSDFFYGAFTLFGPTFQKSLNHPSRIKGSPSTPHPFLISKEDSVFLVRFSVALTHSISIDFFSFGY